MANKSENRTKAERERAETERAKTHAANTLALTQIANQRALVLMSARRDAEQQIIEADRKSTQSIFELAHEAGDLDAQFGLVEYHGQKYPAIDWDWKPFGNSALKIYRNTGSIIENIEEIKIKSDLVFVENTSKNGQYIDREASERATYNYYIFIETIRQGFRAKPVSQPIPAEMGNGKIIDSEGNEITRFNTVEPTSYSESLYFGFKCKRITVDSNESTIMRGKLDIRRDQVELKRYELKIEGMEKDLEFEASEISKELVEQLIQDEILNISKREKINNLINKVKKSNRLDEESKEEIIAKIESKIK